MLLKFTKMQGAGNDFVVLDATRGPIELTRDQLRRLGDRRFGVGADQILLVEPSRSAGVDFRYRIFNNTGDEVEHCGNGARCFVKFAHQQGLTSQRTLRVETVNNLLELTLQDDGRVTVDMNRPIFDLDQVPFDANGLAPRREGGFERWPVDIGEDRQLELAVLSMGNPHAVQRVADVRETPVAELGPRVQASPRFPRGVNVGFMQVLSHSQVALRVFERGAGETLACGTGACAAVVAGIRLGWLNRKVDVQARGGVLTIEWPSDEDTVRMTGPAETVYHGEIEL
ncbi:MAG: diaminopimelate epimerase [Ideonella sp.]|nr:diaminopimelate epimerase [Ideonella sp.]